tara:strand:+ start:1297 stop:1566 length:270 start_codon:yes stop_codon:yes gene_type:complete
MPTYTFKDLKTGKEFDKVMSYEDMIKYKKKKHIEYVIKPFKVFRLNDMGGPEDTFREWCKQEATDIDTSKSKNFRNSKNDYLYSDVKDK